MNDNVTYDEHAKNKTLLYALDDYCLHNCELDCINRSVCKKTIGELKQYLDSHVFTNLKPITELSDSELFDDDADNYPSDYFLACLRCSKSNEYLATWESLMKFINVIKRVWQHRNKNSWLFDENNLILELNTSKSYVNKQIIHALKNTWLYYSSFESESADGCIKFNLKKIKIMDQASNGKR